MLWAYTYRELGGEVRDHLTHGKVGRGGRIRVRHTKTCRPEKDTRKKQRHLAKLKDKGKGGQTDLQWVHTPLA